MCESNTNITVISYRLNSVCKILVFFYGIVEISIMTPKYGNICITLTHELYCLSM